MSKIQSFPPFLKHEGQYTSCPKQIDSVIRAVWEPVFNRSSSNARPTWDLFCRVFKRVLPSPAPLKFQSLTPARLRTVLDRKNAASASGPDGWETACVKALPERCLFKLCELLTRIWPQSLTVGFLSLIPNDDSPSSLRPLSILPVVYRVWASVRLSELMVWQEHWIHPKQCGFRKEHSTMHAWYELALQVEASLLQGTPLVGCFLDFEKAFDLVPLHESVLPLAQHFGLLQGFCSVLALFTATSPGSSNTPRGLVSLFLLIGVLFRGARYRLFYLIFW